MGLFCYNEEENDQAVQIPQELFWTITTLIGGVIGLLAYLWKSKDSLIEKIDGKLDTIIKTQHDITTKVTVMENELSNVNHILRDVQIKISKHDNDIDWLRSKITTVEEWRRNQEAKKER